MEIKLFGAVAFTVVAHSGAIARSDKGVGAFLSRVRRTG